MSPQKPRIGISSCLLGQKVRYNGEHKRDAFLTETLGHYVEWVPVCPELEVGMGVPRESVRLVGPVTSPRMVAERSGKDWTDDMIRYSHRRARELKRLDLHGYILKKDSPSCGMERVKVYTPRGMPDPKGRGFFAQALISELPFLPVEEEGRLNHPRLRENFIERIFAYRRWHHLIGDRKSVRGLVDFHSRHKMLLLAHAEQSAGRLGRIVAGAATRTLNDVFEEYGRLFMGALSVHATVRKHANTLQHMVGYFSDRLERPERAELQEILRDYRRGLVPLIVPITLIRHYVRKYRVAYLKDQVYLQPHPKELMLRNHV